MGLRYRSRSATDPTSILYLPLGPLSAQKACTGFKDRGPHLGFLTSDIRRQQKKVAQIPVALWL